MKRKYEKGIDDDFQGDLIEWIESELRKKRLDADTKRFLAKLKLRKVSNYLQFLFLCFENLYLILILKSTKK